ncbi:MAG: hypothetical protein ACRDTE_30735 [Pseudonocardiaceae bacterium]
MNTDPPVGITDSQLAVLLRQAQWALDDAAHDLPAGRTTPQHRVELAGRLEALALVLRASTPDGAEHSIGEPGDDERRGWCIARCGCALEVPPSGDVFVDCPACAPNLTPTPADHRSSDPRTPAPGDRPDPT